MRLSALPPHSLPSSRPPAPCPVRWTSAQKDSTSHQAWTLLAPSPPFIPTRAIGAMMSTYGGRRDGSKPFPIVTMLEIPFSIGNVSSALLADPSCRGLTVTECVLARDIRMWNSWARSLLYLPTVGGWSRCVTRGRAWTRQRSEPRIWLKIAAYPYWWRCYIRKEWG